MSAITHRIVAEPGSSTAPLKTASRQSVAALLGVVMTSQHLAATYRLSFEGLHDAGRGGFSVPIRVVIAKPGLDGHDRGAKVVARALRDAGMEVIYTGLHQTPEQIVATALQEDAHAIGLSVLSGAHMTLFKRVVELLADSDSRDIVVFGGGIIPDGDIAPLKELGVAEVFTPGTPTSDIVAWVTAHVAANA
jgi:methylmalonyl-CoA mutase C-terminal domain/subunit